MKAIDLHSRLGYYSIGKDKHFNKVSALIEATKTGQTVDWHFNDEVFGAIDWTERVTASLTHLYRFRAMQLRAKYDFVSLFFSGGVDSANVLHAFIDNDIHLDEVVMYRPSSMQNQLDPNDKSVGNIFGEIEYAALPHLREYLKNTTTKVRLIDFDKTAEEFLKDSSMSTQWHTNFNALSANIIPKLSMYLLDPVWNELYLAGKKVCHIHGVDKPIIKYTEKSGYTFSFSDTAGHLTEPTFVTAESDMIINGQYHELFYWTPDLPELVIKQCQIVKHFVQSDQIMKFLFMNSDKAKRSYYTVLHRIIYPEHVNAIRDLFCTEKVGWALESPHGRWIEPTLTKNAYGVYKDLEKFTVDSIGDQFFMGGGAVYLGEKPIESKRDSLQLARSRTYKL